MQNNEPQKKDPYYIWQLISRKLAGKASKSELLELQELLSDNPLIKYSMEILSDLSEPGNGSAEKTNDTPQTRSRDYNNPVQAGPHQVGSHQSASQQACSHQAGHPFGSFQTGNFRSRPF